MVMGMAEVKHKPFTKVTTLDKCDFLVILTLAKNNMNATDTAHELYRSRNGILYRIGKIKRITGLDPMNFYDLCRLVEMAERRTND
jgi:sugar diacid utilization regulator